MAARTFIVSVLSLILVASTAVPAADASFYNFRYRLKHHQFCVLFPDHRTVQLPSLEAGTIADTKLFLFCNGPFSIEFRNGNTGILAHEEFNAPVGGFTNTVPFGVEFLPGHVRSWSHYGFKKKIKVRMTLRDAGAPLLAGRYSGKVFVDVWPEARGS